MFNFQGFNTTIIMVGITCVFRFELFVTLEVKYRTLFVNLFHARGYNPTSNSRIFALSKEHFVYVFWHVHHWLVSSSRDFRNNASHKLKCLLPITNMFILILKQLQRFLFHPSRNWNWQHFEHLPNLRQLYTRRPPPSQCMGETHYLSLDDL